MKYLIAVFLLCSCAVMKEAGEGLVVGLGGAGGALAGGPVGAALGATSTHLAFKAADGEDLQDELNRVNVKVREVEYRWRGWADLSGRLQLLISVSFLLIVIFNPKWLVTVPLWFIARIRK